ncbi:MerR family transcriptional regulator, partial [Clostridioides difficile]|nr:MerR family transcriptional regulator [Clostridioides difficile]
MYKIGEASKITKISSRMLRYYDKENILRPSHVENNGYRYYTEGDINVISKIKNLRRYEFTYEEIKDIFDNNKYE